MMVDGMVVSKVVQKDDLVWWWVDGSATGERRLLVGRLFIV